MAKFLDNDSTFNEFGKLLNTTQEHVTIVTPHLRLSEPLLHDLRILDKKNVRILLIYGEIDRFSKYSPFLKRFDNLCFFVSPLLHARCYLNESSAIISSLNITDHPDHSWDMSILVNRNDDPALYGDILSGVETLQKNCEVWTMDKTGNGEMAEPGVVRMGFCIRCGKEVRFDPSEPYCKKCFKKWLDEENHELEQFCHGCGNPCASDIVRPQCAPCYRNFRALLF